MKNIETKNKPALFPNYVEKQLKFHTTKIQKIIKPERKKKKKGEKKKKEKRENIKFILD